MKITKFFIAAAVSALMMSSVSTNLCADDSIVGAWACNYVITSPEAAAGFESAANATYSASGAYVCDVDIAHQRPFPGFPTGAEATAITGSWKKVRKHHYVTIGSTAVLTLQPDPDDTSINTWQPYARIKEVVQLKIDGNLQTGVKTLTFYDYFDNTLTQPLIDPSTHLPVPPIVETVNAIRVTEGSL